MFPFVVRRRLVPLLFFCALASCERKSPLPANAEHQEVIALFEAIPKGGGVIESDHWYSAWLQGKPTGSHHVIITRFDTPGGVRRVIHSKSQMIMRIGLETSELNMEEEVLVTADWQPVRFHGVETEIGADTIFVHAGKVGTEMVTVRGPEIKRTPFEPGAIRIESYDVLFRKHKPQAGASKTYRTFHTDSGEYIDNYLSIKSAIGDPPVSYEVEQSSEAYPGVIARITLDRDLRPLQIRTRLGALELKLQRVKGRPENNLASKAPDLSPLTRVTTNAKWDSPRNIRRARYRIEGLPGHVSESWLHGPGQRVIAHPSEGTFRIETTIPTFPEPVSFPLAPVDESLKTYLVPTSLSQVQDPLIQATARRVTQGARDAWTAARRLRRFVSEEIDSSRSMSFASAVEVLKQQKGDCSEQSVLLATLARAVGIPARCVMGLVYGGGSFNRHMWTEVWVGRWQPLDAAMQTDRISAAWIRLGEHSLKMTGDTRTGIGGLLAFASELNVWVEESEAGVGPTSR